MQMPINVTWNLYVSFYGLEKVSIELEERSGVRFTLTHPLHRLNKKGCACRVIILATPTLDTTLFPPERALTRNGFVRNHILLTGYHSLALFARILRRRGLRRRHSSIFPRLICADPRIGSITRAFDLLPPPKGFAWIAKNPNRTLLLMPCSILGEASRATSLISCFYRKVNKCLPRFSR